MIKRSDVASHYNSQEVDSFDPWSLTGAVRCPVLVLAGEDDPVCPLAVTEELAGLPAIPPASCPFPAPVTRSSVTAPILPIRR